MQDARLSLTPSSVSSMTRWRPRPAARTESSAREAAATDVLRSRQDHGRPGDRDENTKTGEPLFVVKAGERVDREIYNEWNANAKRLGGWYSSFRGNMPCRGSSSRPARTPTPSCNTLAAIPWRRRR